MTDPVPYVGRFAPSPTGPLHFGSLLAAVASYLQARANGGRWLLRVEDIDPPREQPGATGRIIAALEAYGFAWDGPVIFQSRSAERHDELVQRLLDGGHAYRCTCSRSDLAGARHGPLGVIYPGTCRTAKHTTGDAAIRVRTDDEPIRFVDVLQGEQMQRLESESGDFVIKRRGGLIAYHLAVAADDHAQGITEVVRGIDLLDSTPRQMHLQRLLGFATPAYAHIPVAENADGQKLSKMTGAREIELQDVRPVLVRALHALGQQPAVELAAASLDSIWSWAQAHWRPEVLTGKKSVPAVKYALAAGQNPLS